jgi:hypothetical protein
LKKGPLKENGEGPMQDAGLLLCLAFCFVFFFGRLTAFFAGMDSIVLVIEELTRFK